MTLVAVLLATPAAAEGPGVVVAHATVVDFPRVVEAVGTARANESVEVRTKISEQVTAIHFQEGQAVQAGQPLVELEAGTARAAVRLAEAELADSRAKHTRARELFDAKLVSDSELESARAAWLADEATLSSVRSRLEDTVVRAPFAGRLGLRRVSVGALVTPETVITTLDDIDPIKLDFHLPETALSLVAPGRPVTAHSAAWPERSFEGEVASVDTRVDPVSRSVLVRAVVPNPDELLRPGMFLGVTLSERGRRAVVVPEQALVPEGSRQFVLVLDGASLIERREIEIGLRRPGLVEVVRGLEEGEVVVAEGTQKARPGAPVEIVRTLEVSP